MADREKLQSLHAELTQQEQKLAEIKEQVSASAESHPAETHEHMRSMQDVIAATKKTLQSLIEVLGDAGL